MGSRKTINYRLRDWGVSRQRYWGAPIPIFNLPDRWRNCQCPKISLPVLLPEDVDHGRRPLADQARRRTGDRPTLAMSWTLNSETDTFDTFMESSWYYARFTCPNYELKACLTLSPPTYWLPVDQYVGGIEHAILHLLYARFFHKLMRDQGLVSFRRAVQATAVPGHGISKMAPKCPSPRAILSTLRALIDEVRRRHRATVHHVCRTARAVA